VVGLAGELATPKLVLALQHADGRLHHFAVTRPLSAELAGPVSEVADEASAEAPAIRSRWQHDAVPLWRPVPPRLICEVRVSNLDLSVVTYGKFLALFGCRVSVTHTPGQKSRISAARDFFGPFGPIATVHSRMSGHLEASPNRVAADLSPTSVT
jgi:hypothetical protein